MHQIPPKHCHQCTNLQGVIRQKTGIFIGTTVRTSYFLQYISNIQRTKF